MIQLESQPTCIANGHAHGDNFNIQSSCSEISEEQIANGNQDQLSQCPDIQYIIIDMAPVTFIDSCGSKMLDRVRI